MTAPAFESALDESSARADLGLPASGGVVIVSGGGWGVGDMEGAIATALELEDIAAIVVLCGRSEALRARLEARFGNEPRVQIWGFTDRMSELMGAADALVHSTAGLTVLEAWIRGCRPISYGWGVGHIRRTTGRSSISGSPRWRPIAPPCGRRSSARSRPSSATPGIRRASRRGVGNPEACN